LRVSHPPTPFEVFNDQPKLRQARADRSKTRSTQMLWASALLRPIGALMARQIVPERSPAVTVSGHQVKGKEQQGQRGRHLDTWTERGRANLTDGRDLLWVRALISTQSRSARPTF